MTNHTQKLVNAVKRCDSRIEALTNGPLNEQALNAAKLEREQAWGRLHSHLFKLHGPTKASALTEQLLSEAD